MIWNVLLGSPVCSPRVPLAWGLQVGPHLVEIRLSFSKIQDGGRSKIKTIANDLDTAELGRKLNLFFVKSQ